MIKFKYQHPIIAFVLLNVLSACYYDNMDDLHPKKDIMTILDAEKNACDTNGIISYTNNVKSILSTYCGTANLCHNGTSMGKDLSTYTKVKAASSEILSSITWDGTVSNMPKGSSAPIDPCYIEQIKKWIINGMPE